ncbi:hypothetical protein [Nonomuraea gerenzanensis]|uniref:Uncharacterized protein n=1 Tax=Nonomuraea gerenzanensis TaxID=93944 RepID=A0A1M4BL70_9ACTN|nr:hypothetical protein [Nonomuraea gerenzanensis]UBU19232.1 hypothetical protein LCN96_56380 [Nonomuraea gerenzanensis]SAP16251.1 hypothetical protein BN4615_P11057 [Nonomuraea gerenzanensis]
MPHDQAYDRAHSRLTRHAAAAYQASRADEIDGYRYNSCGCVWQGDELVERCSAHSRHSS